MKFFSRFAGLSEHDLVEIRRDQTAFPLARDASCAEERNQVKCEAY